MRRFLVVLSISLFTAGLAIGTWGIGSPQKYARELVVANHGVEARLAQERYGEKATTLYLLFGDTPEFRRDLYRFGYQQTIPIIHYFLENNALSFEIRDKIAKGIEETKKSYGTGTLPNLDWLGREMTPVERAWMAIVRIEQEGNDFLGCFVIRPDGEVERVMTCRIFAFTKELLAGGIETLEAKYKLHEEITAGDLAWAGIDVAALGLGATAISSAAKGARAGRVSLFARTAAFAPKGFHVSRLAKLGALGFGTYLLVRHPAAFNAALGAGAHVLGVPPLLFQFIGWVVVLSIPLYLLSWVLAPVWWVAKRLGG